LSKSYFGPIGYRAAQILEYFERRGAPCPPSANSADFLVDIVQACDNTTFDWNDQWNASKEYQHRMKDIDSINAHMLEITPPGDDVLDSSDTNTQQQITNSSFATPLLYQILIFTRRQAFALWRNPDYVWNKILSHILNGLLGGFTFWKLGNGIFDMQLHLMAVFNFMIIAPGCINQLQPLFIQESRHLRSSREGPQDIPLAYFYCRPEPIRNAVAGLVRGFGVFVLVFCCWLPSRAQSHRPSIHADAV